MKEETKPDVYVLKGWRRRLFNKMLKDGMIEIKDNELFVTDKFMRQIEKEMAKRNRNKDKSD